MAKRFTRNVIKVKDITSFNRNLASEGDIIITEDDVIFIKSDSSFIEIAVSTALDSIQSDLEDLDTRVTALENA